MKALSTRTHICKCGCELDRDHNAAINILQLGPHTLGHREMSTLGERHPLAQLELASQDPAG